ncbi:E3 ubiquitin-protein ligase RNF123-like [Prorops nasuta]|uniref:E3 ubiquitin-protein ligase RNF123-like n=1 Tax=Prorops nasuta TaxID=863751 RepID=UPI0034CD2E35
METEEILEKIFGSDIIDDLTSVNSLQDEKEKTSRTSQTIQYVDNYIKNVLAKYDAPLVFEDKRIGRIGPNLVRFDLSTHQGLFIVSPDRLSVNSQSNFSTMRANTAVFTGKWMYELQLGSKGVMQLGWSTAKCKFNQQSGVGDTPNSFAYDGNRVRKWNMSTHKYGEAWLSGDIIGCAIDLNEGTIEFCRNGKLLGLAFDKVSIGPGIAYFPTVSLGFTENLTANFGATPLRYPIDGYEALQIAPFEKVGQTVLLLKWFSKMVEIIDKIQIDQKQASLEENKIMSTHAFLMCLVRCILKLAGPLLTVPYIVESVFVPYIQKLSLTSNMKFHNINSDTSELMTCLDLLWTFLEEHELKSCLESTIVYLFSTFRVVSLLLEYPEQCKSLVVLVKVCQHTKTRQRLLQNMLFDRVWFANFVHVKPLDEDGLAAVINKVWWETNPVDPSIETNKQDYFDACKRIKSAISEIEELQMELLLTLLNNSDGTDKTPTSRTIFLKKFRRFVQEHVMSNRTPLPITFCCFHRLLVTFRTLWDKEVGSDPVYIPCRVFYDASISYSGIDRLGGVISHLHKTFKNELMHLLGPEHEVMVAMEQTRDTSSASFIGGALRQGELPMLIPIARMINLNAVGPGSSMIVERLGYLPFWEDDRTPPKPGTADPVISLLELLDGIILFYHAAVKKQVAKLASLKESISDYIAAIADTKSRLEIVQQNDDIDSQLIQTELLRAIEVFTSKLSEHSRHMAWVRAAVFSEEKQTQLTWLLKVVILTLRTASEEGNMFSFVPDFYLDAMSDLFVGIRNHLHPTIPIEGIPDYKEILLKIADFLCNHFLDPRIVNASAKDTLILALAGFVSNPLTLEAMENVPIESKLKVVNNLLKPYENRAWAQSNWVLVRFWQGHGFAFRYEKSPHLTKKVGPKTPQQEYISQPIKPCPSVVFQGYIRDALLNNSQSTTQFLNSLLNQLNWAFSEFIGMVQEIHNVSSRPERGFIESRQLKICAACFDLTISLLRVLEMICSVALNIFSDPSQTSSETLLARLCQLLSQVLNRMSSQTSCFQHVVLMEIPDLESVDHFPILTAVIGILLALLKEDMKISTPNSISEVPEITKTLLFEPSFQMDSLCFVIGGKQTNNMKRKNVKPFSFSDYETDVMPEEIDRVQKMIEYLNICNRILPNPKTISDDEDTCTICYAFPIAVTFKPCNHQTCRACIDRHLLNTRECFFCKSKIEKVFDMSDKILHDFTKTKETLEAQSSS